MTHSEAVESCCATASRVYTGSAAPVPCTQDNKVSNEGERKERQGHEKNGKEDEGTPKKRKERERKKEDGADNRLRERPDIIETAHA